MYSYDSIITACYQALIDPRKRGNNIKADLKPMFAGNVVNLTLIRFCDESKEVMCIGSIVNCMVSQIPTGPMTLEEGKKSYPAQANDHRRRTIPKFLV